MSHWALAALLPLLFAGCSGAFLGHFAVLGVTLSIFLGTLGMNRPARPTALAPKEPSEPALKL